jgi:hypothetical protein
MMPEGVCPDAASPLRQLDDANKASDAVLLIGA